MNQSKICEITKNKYRIESKSKSTRVSTNNGKTAVSQILSEHPVFSRNFASKVEVLKQSGLTNIGLLKTTS